MKNNFIIFGATFIVDVLVLGMTNISITAYVIFGFMAHGILEHVV